MKAGSEVKIHHNSPMVVSDLGSCQFCALSSQRLNFIARDPQERPHVNFQICNFLKSAPIPKKEKGAHFSVNLNEKRRRNFSQCFVLKAETRLRRGVT